MAAQFSYTDLVIGAANTVTSAAFPFSTLVNGNLLHINSGVNFTPGWYEVVSVAGVTATLDRSPGTVAAVGGTAKLGGALSTPNDTPAIQGGTVWLQAGAGYTTGVQWVLNDGVGDGNFVVYAGYTTTRGDEGLATVTSLGALAPMLTQANQIIVKNLVIDGANLATRGINMGFDGLAQNVKVTRCSLSGMLAQNEGTRVRRCLFTFNGAGAGAGTGLDVGTGCLATECEAHDNKQGFTSNNGTGEFVRCVSYNNTGSGFYQAGDDGMRLRNCLADGNAVDGLHIQDASGLMTMEVANCLFTNNTGMGIRSTTTDYSGGQFAAVASFFLNNAFIGNGSNYSGVPAGAADIILTADPYTSRATFDFSLNSTTGGGLSLQGAGVPGGFGVIGTGALNSTGHIDVGAVQGLAAASGGTSLSGMRSLWREYTNERNSIVVPDVTVDIYLQSGLEALNRRVRYHWADSTTDVTLVASTQEYAVPADCVEIVWLEWNGFEVAKTSMDQLRSRLVNWRGQKAGPPQEWLFYRNRIVLVPAPDTATVTTNNHIVFRYVSTPPSITTNGPEQLNSQDYRVPVYHGVAEWASAHPDSALATLRSQSFRSMFETEADTIGSQYDARLVAR